ncbi:MAG: Rieske 2Fe-2S domain-containing protein [Thermoanaerobaculia bacterium]
MESSLARDPNASFSRRRWIDALLGTSFVAWAGAVVYPMLRYLTPLKDGGGANKITLTDAQKQELASNGFLIARLGTDRVLVLKDRSQKLLALSAKCTHEGCTVQFLPADSIVWCACHNGKFALDGRVISGPPPRPLAAFEVGGDLKGVVTITRGSAA